MKLEDFLNLWIETYYQAPRRAPRTVSAYRYALAHLSPEILAAKLEDLTPLQLQREINSLAALYSRQGQILHSALHAALRQAVRLGMLRINPMDQVDRPEHEKREIAVMNGPEAAAYLAAARESADPRAVLLILMLCLGLRRNEARALRPDDLDADGILHIRHQLAPEGLAPLKSASSRRDIPVPEPLRSFFRGQEGEYLVPCSENGLRRVHLAILAQAQIPARVTLHGLRHTAATMAITQGAELVTVQQLLGHRHYTLTADLYIHPSMPALTKTTSVIYHGIGQNGRIGARLEIV